MRSVPPQRIVLADASDELLELGAEGGVDRAGFATSTSIQSPTLPMPPQDALWLHDPEMLSPASRPEVTKPDPEDSITSAEVGMRVGAQGDLELMPEDQVLERQIAARSKGSDERTKHEEE